MRGLSGANFLRDVSGDSDGEGGIWTRGKKSNCHACQRLQLGRPRSRSPRRPLASVSRNKRRRQAVWGCEQCDVAICNSRDCQYFYHRLK
ncbi:Cytochrome P450 monooxygenase atnE [Fusarium oxysporum f. sp. albedinis]|nr:Cytochrome P450 monooxygenase atnE [Fusarium oxysporum f. sp. albedinis]